MQSAGDDNGAHTGSALTGPLSNTPPAQVQRTTGVCQRGFWMSANGATQRWTVGLMAGALLSGVLLLNIVRAALNWEQRVGDRICVVEGPAHDALRWAV